ncbi:hypothetical protein C8R44DRAFT_144604 [Mycena epipterygia]|nr:hypothetical protein C8R44DRAFT_144604 [Mycena epipterygia]
MLIPAAIWGLQAVLAAPSQYRNGVRNLVFGSGDGDGIDTWIRLEGGETRARVHRYLD